VYVPQCGFSAATQFRENDGSEKNGRRFRRDTERTCLVSLSAVKKKEETRTASTVDTRSIATNMSLSLVKEESIVNFHPGFASERAEFYLPPCRGLAVSYPQTQNGETFARQRLKFVRLVHPFDGIRK